MTIISNHHFFVVSLMRMLWCFVDFHGTAGRQMTKRKHKPKEGALVLSKLITMSIIAGSIMLSAISSSLATEEKVSFTVDGKKIVGVLNIPDDVKAPPPVALLLHGFTGTRDEWKSEHVKEGLYGRAAPFLAKRGIATLRIDFRGSGESEGDYSDTTVQSQIKDADAALDFLTSRRDVDSKRLSIVGMSLGGAVTTAVAGRTAHPLASVVLWNPGINLPAAFTTIFGEKGIQAGLAAGDQPYTAKLGDKTVSLKAAFFRSLYEVVPAAEIAKYRGPLLLAVGTTDTIVFPQPYQGQTLLSYHQGPHELWAQSVDHGFDLMKTDTTVDALIQKTADFIAANSGSN